LKIKEEKTPFIKVLAGGGGNIVLWWGGGGGGVKIVLLLWNRTWILRINVIYVKSIQRMVFVLETKCPFCGGQI